MHECSALLEFLLCNHAGFKIVPGSFCEYSVILDLVLHFLMHCQFWLHYSTRSGSFCRGLKLFCSSVEASFFGCDTEDSASGGGCSSSSYTE